MRNLFSFRAASVAAALCIGTSAAPHAFAVPDGEVQILREQIRQLDQKLRVLERKQELKDETAAAAAAKLAPVTLVAADRRGLYVESADKTFSFRIRPRIQVDAHGFPEDTDGSTDMTLRRVRPVLEGKAGPLKWRFMPELAGTIRILDAWGDVQLTPNTLVRVGKTKTAVGYERLQSFSKTLFLERGLPSVLTTTRDIGVQLHSSTGVVDWSIGVTSGALDDTDLSANVNLSSGDFDFEGRVFVQPFRQEKDHALAGLGFGLAAQTGSENVAILDSDRDRRIRYRTAGRNTFFRYNDGVLIDGDRTRINPFLSYYSGSFGFLTEWVCSGYDLTRSGVSQSVDTEAWTVQVGWVLTGEAASYGGFRPAKSFDPPKGKWGALEVGLRYNVLEVGDEAFAGPAAVRLARGNATQKAEAWGVALNWVLTDNLLIGLNYESTEFSGLGAARDSEQVVLSRLQLDF